MRLLVVLGTRPEAIKLAPIVLAARRHKNIDVFLCNTGQHREMTTNALSIFGLVPDICLDIMRPNQTLTDVNVNILIGLQPHLEQIRPDWLMVQGDTTTSFAAALAAFYQKIAIAHIEAGLRTGKIYSPWPEEANRRMISEITTMHFPPTSESASNLRREGFRDEEILVTGNTGIDALKWLISRLAEDLSLRSRAIEDQLELGVPVSASMATRPFVLITAHRRESFGVGFEDICDAIGELANRFPSHDFIYPVHPNPAVRETVFSKLGSGRFPNVYLVQPLDYLPFVDLMSKATLILTDSGGVQEEAPSLGIRVVVLRDVTERLEGVGSGLIRLAGTDRRKIVAYVSDALDGGWLTPSEGCDAYGDGLATDRILDKLMNLSMAMKAP